MFEPSQPQGITWGLFEDNKPTFLHDTLAHDNASPYQVWLHEVQQLSSRWTFAGIVNLSCVLDLDHNRAIQSFHKTILLMMMFKRYIKKWYFDYMILWSDLDPEDSKPIWPMVMHHHTKFGSKRFSDSEDIVWANKQHSLKFEILLWPWPWTQQSNFFIRHSGLWQCAIKVWYQKDQQSRKYSRNCHILITRALPMNLTIANQSFCITLQLMMMHHNTKFGKYHLDKHWHFDQSLWLWYWMHLSNFFFFLFHKTL